MDRFAPNTVTDALGKSDSFTTATSSARLHRRNDRSAWNLDELNIGIRTRPELRHRKRVTEFGVRPVSPRADSPALKWLAHSAALPGG